MYRARVTEAIYNDDYSNSHKYYRTYVIYDEEAGDARVLYNWGRIGATGQFKVEVTYDQWTARSLAEQKMSSKYHKGYEHVRTAEMEVVPNDILERAGINLHSSTPIERVSEFGQFNADVDVAIRKATGDLDSQVEAVVMVKSLDERLQLLRQSVLEAESRLEVAQMFVTEKIG